jgi:hypothetical protein
MQALAKNTRQILHQILFLKYSGNILFACSQRIQLIYPEFFFFFFVEESSEYLYITILHVAQMAGS